MASELSRFIEQELERKGIDPDDDRRNLIGRESFRIESRSHAQENQRRASKTTRNFCVGGGIFLAMVLIIYFLSKSSTEPKLLNKETIGGNNSMQSPAPNIKSNATGTDGNKNGSAPATNSSPPPNDSGTDRKGKGNSAAEPPVSENGGNSTAEPLVLENGGNSTAGSPVLENGGNSTAGSPVLENGGNSTAGSPVSENGGNSAAEPPVSENGGNSAAEPPVSENGGNRRRRRRRFLFSLV